MTSDRSSEPPRRNETSTSGEARVQAYVGLVRTAEALHAEVSRGLVVEGFTASQFSTMKVLRRYGRLAQRDIARHILKSGGNITILVDHLEREGFVRRARDTEDRRLVWVTLTEAGETLFDRLYPPHLERIHAAMGGLTDEECATLATLLGKLHADPDAVCPPVKTSTAGLVDAAA